MSDQPAVVEEEAELPPVPVEKADPLEDEGADMVQLVRTGFVRIRYTMADGAGQLRLRRPFLGELKRLRLALEEMNDAISAAADEAEAERLKILAEADRIDAAGLEPSELVRQRSVLKARNRVAARALAATGDEQRLGWWRQVFAVVSVDGELPDEDLLPSWFTDHRLPGLLLSHWRSVPLAPG